MTRTLACLISLLYVVQPLDTQGEGYWDRRFWMADVSTPSKLATDGDGRLLMAGGLLSAINGAGAGTTVGSWDGHRWSTISTQPFVTMIGSAGTTWLVSRPGTNSVTRVSAAGESVVLPAVEGRILTLAIDDLGLLAGGEFVTGTANAATNVARWNGADWIPLGAGLSGVVTKLSATEGGVFAAIAGTLDQPSSAWRWDGLAWTLLAPLPPASSPPPQITDLAWHGGKLIAAITKNASATNTAVLAWSGSQWEPYGTPRLTGGASSLAVFQGDLYVAGGSFKVENVTSTFFGVARLTGGQWRPVELSPGVVQSRAVSLAATRNELFLLCALPKVLGVALSESAFGLWQFDGHDWWLHGGGPSYMKFAAAEGGQAASSGNIVLSVIGGGAPNVAGRNGFLWDGYYLKPLGIYSPEPGATLTLGNQIVTTATQVYRPASRNPATTGGANLLTRLEGTNWVAHSAPTTLSMNAANALAAEGENIYVSGHDTTVPGSPNAVARWQGTNNVWEQFAGYFDGTVLALAARNGQPVVGGTFKTVAGQPITNLARWDGTGWQAVTPAPDGTVRAFARWGNDLVVAGGFTNIGGIQARGLALWTAAGGWESLSEGLEMTGPGSYAGPGSVAIREDGTIAVATAPVQASEVWLRRGTNWERIGTTFGDGVHALCWQGQDLFAVGAFFGVDDVESGRFAIWHEAMPGLMPRRLPDQSLQLHWTGAYPGASVLETGSSPDQFTPWRTNSPMDLHRDFTHQPAPGSAQDGSAQEFYRARLTE